MSQLQRLMDYQKENPEALEVNIPSGQDMIIPTAAITSIQSTWGYIITAQSTPIPNGYTGNITNWSKITKVAW